MMFPLDTLLVEQRELGLVVAVACGFGFGFVLERAGFGQASKLVSQFYGDDMTVFKVMFTGIVTAMVGLALLAGVGLVDFAAVASSATSSTWIVPLAVAGFLLGVGFITAGYCPGTSLVAAASGNLDGLLTFVGVIGGTLVYSELQPLMGTFPDMTDLGQLYLWQLTGLPVPVLALLVALMAIGCFIGAEKLEKIFSRRQQMQVEPKERWPLQPRRWAFAAMAGIAVASVATLAVPVNAPAAAQRQIDALSPQQLAVLVLQEPWSVRVLDLRDPKECAKQRIPGAECVGPSGAAKLGLADDPGTRMIVLAKEVTATTPSEVLAYPGKLAVVAGGYSAWRSYALTAPAVPLASASAADRQAYKIRAGLHSALTGVQQAAPPPAAGGTAAPKKKKGGGGCSG